MTMTAALCWGLSATAAKYLQKMQVELAVAGYAMWREEEEEVTAIAIHQIKPEYPDAA